MARYIDADKVNVRLLKAAGHETYMGSKGRGKGLRQAVDIVNEQPTADVQAVKHGHWADTYIEDNIEYGYCSLCSAYVMVDNYCSYCGARMDEEVAYDKGVSG